MGMVVFAIESFNFLAIPFLLLFVGGYYWAGCIDFSVGRVPGATWQNGNGSGRWRYADE